MNWFDVISNEQKLNAEKNRLSLEVKSMKIYVYI